MISATDVSASRLAHGSSRVLAFALILAALSTTRGFGVEPDQPVASRPNVLLIAVDDLNDWVAPLKGHPQAKTPNFDRLARRGVTFTNAHCSVPICSPSRTSLMTGVQPFRSGVYSNGESVFDVDESYVTLPEHFAKHGYRTLGAGKLFHGSGGKYAKFFQTYGPGSGNQGGPFTREELDTNKQNPTHVVDRGPGKLNASLPMNGMPDDRRTDTSRNNSFDWGPVNVSADEMPDGEVANWAVEQLAAESSAPFFLGVGFYRPHQPLFAPAKYFQSFPAGSVRLPATQSQDLGDLPSYAQQLAVLPLTAGRHDTVVQYDQWDDAVAAYLSCVLFVDDLIGRVVDALDASPHADNTWIVLFSDHGYHLGEKQHWGKFTTWRESTRVPLIVVPPRNRTDGPFVAGSQLTTPVSLIDLFPTLVDVCGLPPVGHELDGESLLSVAKQTTGSENVENVGRTVVTTVGRGTHSIVSDHHRYIRYFDGSEELYDWSTDPQEWTNRAGDQELSRIQDQLSARIPEDDAVAYYVRYGDWKAVLFYDPHRQPLLFAIEAGTGGGGGIGETNSVATQHPEVIKEILDRVQRHPSPVRRMTLDEPTSPLPR